MNRRAVVVRICLFAEVIFFSLAALFHRALASNRHQHVKAAVAESVIAVALSAGLAVCVHRPEHTRRAALCAQLLALLGVCVGLVMILAGAAPRSAIDYAISVSLLLILSFGIGAARRVAAL